jgi:hypothetical protein
VKVRAFCIKLNVVSRQTADLAMYRTSSGADASHVDHFDLRALLGVFVLGK